MSEPAGLPPSAARDAALEQLRNEHRMLARVIEALETLTAETAEGREFERLYHRIVNLLPRKLKLPLLKPQSR